MPAPLKPLALRVEQLGFAYNGSPALVDINLAIRPGEFVAIVGQNGSGKTTLVKHFNGLLKPTAGRVWVGERDTAQVTVAELARDVGYVFQNPDHQINQPTVRAEVEFGLRCFGFAEVEIKPRVDETLAAFGLAAYAGRPPAVLGFGLRRKIALASVCVMRPPVLILDEPTGGLEARAADEIMELAVALHAAGHTILLVSHDMRRVAACAERCLVLHRGRLLCDAVTREVFADLALLAQACLTPPPVTQLGQALQLGVPLTVAEFYDRYASTAA